MKNFIEKWRTDSKFKAVVQLGAYTLIAVIGTTIALTNSSKLQADELKDEYDGNEVDNQIGVRNIEIPNKYNYTIDINIDKKNYKYIGNKEQDKETITKITSEVSQQYKREIDKYYKEENGQYLPVTKEEIYDDVNYNYLQLENINKYLLKSEKKEDKFLVYLKDIVLGNESEEYITIEIFQNIIINQQIIKVDYTPLIKAFNSDIEKYYIQIEIEEIE